MAHVTYEKAFSAQQSGVWLPGAQSNGTAASTPANNRRTSRTHSRSPSALHAVLAAACHRRGGRVSSPRLPAPQRASVALMTGAFVGRAGWSAWGMQRRCAAHRHVLGQMAERAVAQAAHEHVDTLRVESRGWVGGWQRWPPRQPANMSEVRRGPPGGRPYHRGGAHPAAGGNAGGDCDCGSGRCGERELAAHARFCCRPHQALVVWLTGVVPHEHAPRLVNGRGARWEWCGEATRSAQP